MMDYNFILKFMHIRAHQQFCFVNFFKQAESFFYKANSLTVSLSVNMLLIEENTAEGKPSFVPNKMKELIQHHVNCIPHQNINLIFFTTLCCIPNLMSSWLMTDGGHEKKKFF